MMRKNVSLMRPRSGAALRKSSPYIMLLPAFLFIAAFMLYPIINTFIMSVTHNSMADKFSGAPAGFENFINLFKDEVFLKTLGNSAVWTFSNVILQAVLGMVLALILNMKFRGRGLCRALAFTPWAVAGITVALMWSFMMNESVGVINDLLMKLGLVDERLSWFSSGGMAMAAVVIANTWRGIPFFAISFLSALQNIPGELYESAQVDGAGPVRKFFKITLPMIKDTVILTTLLRTIWTLNTVDIIFGMTRGGPNNATATVPVYIMTLFNDTLNFSYSSAAAVVMAVILLIFSAIYLLVSRYGKEEIY